MPPTDSKDAQIAIMRGTNSKEALLNCISKLGNISKYINEGDKVFIKINLTLPNGFPSNINFDVLRALVNQCLSSGAEKIQVGSFPYENLTIKSISDQLGLQDYLKDMGAELAFLDNSNYFSSKKPDSDLLKNIKDRSFVDVEVNGTKYSIPKVIQEADKIIILNQVNVQPLFNIRLSIESIYSIISQKQQQVKQINLAEEDGKIFNAFNEKLISKILDVFSIRKPDLVINDLFYVLEGSGPFIYKDSKLKETDLIIAGDDAIAVDLATLKVLGLDILKNELIGEAIKRDLGVSDLANVNIKGEKIEELTTTISLCPNKLENIHVRRFKIKCGEFCSGCFRQAFHLLNLIKTNMVKDLKYISTNSFLIGQNPPNPEDNDNILIFGDCAVKSTKKLDFRIIRDEKISKKGKKKITIKPNKKVLEIPGCPPVIEDVLASLINFYGKLDVPTLNLFYEIIQFYMPKKTKKQLEVWEGL